MQSRYYDPAIGRFLNVDTVLNSSGETNGFSLYTYGANNPVLNEDSSGYIPVETVLDIASIGASAYDLVTRPCWSNLGYLAWDVTAAAVPYVPSFYVAKPEKYAGKAVGASSKMAKAAKLEKAAKKLKASKKAPKVVKATGKKASNQTGKRAFKTQALLDSHYAKHTREFGNITKNQYLKSAQSLVNSRAGGNILMKKRSNGDLLFYNKANNTFAIKASDGTIRT